MRSTGGPPRGRLRVLRRPRSQSAWPSEAERSEACRRCALRTPDVDFWHDPADGFELLDDITRTILRYLALPETTAQTAVVWEVHTHCHDAFTISPRLAITSPEKGCGRTTLLDVLSCMSRATGLQCQGGGNLPRRRDDEVDTSDGRG
jgi:hypothetical protein